MSTLFDFFENIEDKRDPNKIIYPLSSLLFMSVCAVFCGAETWEDIPIWVESRIDWLSKFINMSCGIPSYSTFRRLFQMISPSCWSKLINESIQMHHHNLTEEDQVSIDGKRLRGNKCDAKGIKALHMVSAYSVANNIVLGDLTTETKSNEIKAIPVLLDLLELKNTTVTIDAIGCNNTIAQSILTKGADYLLNLKSNQKTLFKIVQEYAEQEGTELENLVEDYFDRSHGRSTRRRYFAFEATEAMKNHGIEGLKTIIATETISSDKYGAKGVRAEWRYYITSHEHTNDNLSKYIRGHWSVESYHWLLDVHLNDDHDKKYDDIAAENFAKTKRFLLDSVKSNPPQGKKRSIRSNIKKLSWDLEYLEDLIFSNQVEKYS